MCDVPPIPDERAIAKLHALHDGHRHRVLTDHEQELLRLLDCAEPGHLVLGYDSGPVALGVDEACWFHRAVDGLADVGLIDAWEFEPQDARLVWSEYRLYVMRPRTPRPD